MTTTACVHHYRLGEGVAAEGRCTKCGARRAFTGGVPAGAFPYYPTRRLGYLDDKPRKADRARRRAQTHTREWYMGEAW